MIYTFGYSGQDVNKLKEWVVEHDALLIDIRFSPRSRIPQWNFSRLKDLFLDVDYDFGYQLLSQWGNKNFKSGEIEIADFECGLSWFRGAMDASAFKNIVLMCQCKNYQTCHRKVIADKLRELGYESQELEI